MILNFDYRLWFHTDRSVIWCNLDWSQKLKTFFTIISRSTQPNLMNFFYFDEGYESYKTKKSLAKLDH